MHLFLGDVYKAFGSLEAAVAAEDLRRQGCPARLIAALMNERRRNEVQVAFQQISLKHWISSDTAVRTGSKEATRLWTASLRQLMEESVDVWDALDMGVKLQTLEREKRFQVVNHTT